jgi:hypothetical protein
MSFHAGHKLPQTLVLGGSLMNVNRRFCAIGLALSAVLAACASPVQTTAVKFAPSTGGEVSLGSNVQITLSTGYSRTLGQGSRWRKVGTVPQGDVYRPVDTVFTIEGRNVHEAYLVLNASRALVAFYLPGESNLSPLPAPVLLTLKETP